MTLINAIVLFREHDVFMEISYPTIYALLVPEEKMLGLIVTYLEIG